MNLFVSNAGGDCEGGVKCHAENGARNPPQDTTLFLVPRAVTSGSWLAARSPARPLQCPMFNRVTPSFSATDIQRWVMQWTKGELVCWLTAIKSPPEEKGDVCQGEDNVGHLEIVRAKLECPAESDNPEDIDHREWKACKRPSTTGIRHMRRLFIGTLLWSTLFDHFGIQNRTPLENANDG